MFSKKNITCRVENNENLSSQNCVLKDTLVYIGENKCTCVFGYPVYAS